MKKRIIALCLITMSVVNLAGCRNQTEKNHDLFGSETSEIAGSQIHTSTGVAKEQALIMGQAIEEADFTMTPIYCQNTTSAHALHQDSDIAMYSTRGSTQYVDLVLTLPTAKAGGFQATQTAYISAVEYVLRSGAASSARPAAGHIDPQAGMLLPHAAVP